MTDKRIKNGMTVELPQLPFRSKFGEIYIDENGTEIYMPETEEHTSFNLKLPYGYSIRFAKGMYPRIVF